MHLSLFISFLGPIHYCNLDHYAISREHHILHNILPGYTCPNPKYPYLLCSMGHKFSSLQPGKFRSAFNVFIFHWQWAANFNQAVGYTTVAGLFSPGLGHWWLGSSTSCQRYGCKSIRFKLHYYLINLFSNWGSWIKIR